MDTAQGLELAGDTNHTKKQATSPIAATAAGLDAANSKSLLCTQFNARTTPQYQYQHNTLLYFTYNTESDDMFAPVSLTVARRAAAAAPASSSLMMLRRPALAAAASAPLRRGISSGQPKKGTWVR